MAEGGEAPEFECPICFDTIPPSEAASLCGKGHRFCPDCCWRCCQSALGDGLVPACPHDKEAKCGTIPKQAASAALSRWLCQKGEQQTRKAELQAAGWSIRGSKAAGFTSGKLDEVYLSAERARQGAVQCIGKRCKEWLVPPIPHSPLAQRLVCSSAKCGASFCAACRHPYHFRSTCAEALRINARWVRFLQTELGAFLMAAVRVEPERYGATLKAYVKSKSALDEATRDALQRFEELKKMELWKEKHCRHCPNCKRVVEKLRRHALSPNPHPNPNPNPNPHPSSKS